MSWYEYNEELHIKNERAIAFEEGMEYGIERERKRTEQEINRLKKEIEMLRSQK